MQGLDKKTSPRLVMDKIPNHPGEIVWFFCLFFGGIAFELIIGWYSTRLSTTRPGQFYSPRRVMKRPGTDSDERLSDLLATDLGKDANHGISMRKAE